jgi:hypothetical protein
LTVTGRLFHNPVANSLRVSVCRFSATLPPSIRI